MLHAQLLVDFLFFKLEGTRASTGLCLDTGISSGVIYIISEETYIFAPQRLRFYKALGVAACTVGKVRASTVFMCVCSMFRSSDFLLFVKNGFVVGVHCQGNREPPADGATTPLSQRQHCIHTQCVLSCTAGGKQAARGREGARENRRWEGQREQGAGGREEAMI